MNLVELQRALRQLRLGGMAAVLGPMLEAQSDRVGPIDCLDARHRRAHATIAVSSNDASSTRNSDPRQTVDTFDLDFTRI